MEGPIIVRVKPSEVWEFAWQRMPSVLRDNLLLYILLLVVGVVLTSWSSTPSSFHTPGIEWIAGVAALGATVRGVAPSYAMTLRSVGWVVLFYVLVFVAGFMAFATLVVVGPWLHQLLVPVALLELLVIVWLGVKLSATPAFYALRKDHHATIFAAVRLSWHRISGERWAQLFSAQLLISIGAVVIIAAFGLGALFGLHGRPMVAVILASSAYYIIVIPTTALSMAMTVAIAASSEPVGTPTKPGI